MDFNRAVALSRAIDHIIQAKAILDEITPEEQAVYDELKRTAPNSGIEEYARNVNEMELAADLLTDSLEPLSRVVVPKR